MDDDAALLHRYAEEKSEAAFAEFVHGRIALVYAVALRKVGGDRHLAEDVAQRVFAEAAKSAASLAQHPAVVGWLFKSTHYIATQVVRTEHRRKAREEKAATMNEMLYHDEAVSEIEWERLRPVLDDLVSELGERDRAAILWRFFEGHSLAEIGARLQLSEAGARSRVERAVEKLRHALARRGVTSTAVALSGALAQQAGFAAPTGLAVTVTNAALAGAASMAAPSALAVFMSATKTAFAGSAFLSLAGVLMLSSVSVAFYQAKTANAAETAHTALVARYQTESAALKELERTARDAQQRLTEARARAEASGSTAAKISPASGSVTSTAAERDPATDARKFLAAIGEAGRNDVRNLLRRQIATAYTLMWRDAGLTTDQHVAFERRLVQYSMEHLHFTSGGLGTDPAHDELPDDELRTLFGEDGFRRWREAGRKGEAYSWVNGLALRLNADASAAPLTAEQMNALVGVVARHSPQFLEGGEIEAAKVNWTAVSNAAQSMLSPSQWRQTQAWVLKQEVEREFAALKTKEPNR